jgi:hypothetical protein
VDSFISKTIRNRTSRFSGLSGTGFLKRPRREALCSRDDLRSFTTNQPDGQASASDANPLAFTNESRLRR